MKGILLAGAVVAACGFGVVPASAQTTAGQIGYIFPISAGVLFFQHTGARASRPACATQDRWVINPTTPMGQAMLSTLLTAYASNKAVVIFGSNDCHDWGDTESVSGILIASYSNQ